MSGVLAVIGSAPPGIIQAISNGSAIDPGDVTFSLGSDGTYVMTGSAGGSWVIPNSVAAKYDVKVDPTAGSFTTGTTGTWLSMASNRTWTLETVGTVVFTVSFRESLSGLVQSVQTGVQMAVDV